MKSFCLPKVMISNFVFTKYNFSCRRGQCFNLWPVISTQCMGRALSMIKMWPSFQCFVILRLVWLWVGYISLPIFNSFLRMESANLSTLHVASEHITANETGHWTKFWSKYLEVLWLNFGFLCCSVSYCTYVYCNYTYVIDI